MRVCGGRVMELFRSHELMAVVIGNEDYDWDALEQNAEYKEGYKSSDQTVSASIELRSVPIHCILKFSFSF